MQTILITGANRGLGLELTRQYAQDGWRVLACCREPEQAEALDRIAGSPGGGRVTLYRLEVTDATQIQALARELQDQAMDILMINAGIYGPRNMSFGELDESSWLEAFRVNTIAPLRLAAAFADHVAQSRRKVLAAMSSRMGSIRENAEGGDYIYRSSKAALNSVMKTLSIDLKARGIAVVTLHPGWVRTDMGGNEAPLDMEESVRGLRAVLARVNMQHTGRFLAYDGSEIPW